MLNTFIDISRIRRSSRAVAMAIFSVALFGSHLAMATDAPVTRYAQSFEANQLPDGWHQSADARGGWSVVSCPCVDGSFSLTNELIADEQYASIEFTDHFKAGVLSFDYHYLQSYDGAINGYLSVTVDDNEAVAYNRGEGQWQRIEIEVPEGVQTLRWSYHQVAEREGEQSQVFIDNVRYFSGDQDRDGIADHWEYSHGLNYDNREDGDSDNDADSLSNRQEYQLQSNPNKADTDGDQLSDADEVSLLTDISNTDTDRDGFEDGWEVSYNFDPLKDNDQDEDTDDDGLTDFQEYQMQTSPVDALDKPVQITRLITSFETPELPQGMRNAWKRYYGVRNKASMWVQSNDESSDGEGSLVASSRLAVLEWTGDFDEGLLTFDYKTEGNASVIELTIDGYSKREFSSEQWQQARVEVRQGIHTIALKVRFESRTFGIGWLDNLNFTGVSADTDEDGLPDLWENAQGLDRLDAADANLDNDNDGLTNIEEYQAGSDIFAVDSDNDGLSDGEEVALGTEPGNSDSDGDGMPDGWEVANQTNPQQAASATLDSDGDGVIDLNEYLIGTAANDDASVTEVINQRLLSFESGELPADGLGVWQVPAQVTIPTSNDEVWSGQVNLGWQVSTVHASEGEYGLGSAVGSDTADVAAIQWTADFSGGEIRFDWRTDGLADHFIFLIDGVRQGLSGFTAQGWTQSIYLLSQGVHTLQWIQLNDDHGVGATSWIDNLMVNHDSDNDGLPDFWETQMGFDSNDAADATLDPDNDGLNNIGEFAAGTEVGQADTDGDGVSDGDEVLLHFTNPLKRDSDEDGLPDNWEINTGLNPLLANESTLDTDQDGVSDWGEYVLSTLPNDSSSTPPLTTLFEESFESGVMPPGFITPDGDYSWEVIDAVSADSDGDYVVACKEAITHTCSLQWSAYLPKGTFIFDIIWFSTSVDLFINNERVFWPQEYVKYTRAPIKITEQKVYTFKWVYQKYGNLSEPSFVKMDNLHFFALDSDIDGDGIPDKWEFNQGLDWKSNDNRMTDTDGDGLTDFAEYQLGTDVNNTDSDNDGVSDGAEVNEYGTSPLNKDSDADGLIDQWEVDNQLDPLNSADASTDSDGDGFSNLHEVLVGSNPFNGDEQPPLLSSYVESFENTTQLSQGWSAGFASDVEWRFDYYDKLHGRKSLRNEVLDDGQQAVLFWAGNFTEGELQFGWMANNDTSALYIDGELIGSAPNDKKLQRFNHHLSGGFHVFKWLVTDPAKNFSWAKMYLDDIRFFADGSDVDADGIADAWEYQWGLSFNDAADALLDADNDGANNLAEYLAGTSPDSSDSDNDGFPDGWEIEFGLDPLVATQDNDTDGDGFSDSVEYQQGTSPVDAASIPVVIVEYLESFEGEALPLGWLVDVVDGDVVEGDVVEGAGWQLANDHSTQGQISLSSGDVNDSQSTAIEFEGFFAAGELSFWLKTASEQYFDSLDFYLDGVLQTRYSGDVNWQLAQVSLSAGAHTLRWVYSKDVAVSEGLDRVWLDNVNFFAVELDSDGDGLADFWEHNQGLDRFNSADAAEDTDNDGLTNLQEYQAGTKPQVSDSDNDGLPDSWEVQFGLDPLVNDAAVDSDNDGLTNAEEFALGSSPMAADTDGDGVSDRDDRFVLDNTESADNDNDGIGNNADLDDDNDGLADLVEIAAGLDPFNPNDRNADTDGDGYINLEEARVGSDPTDAASVPAEIAPWLKLLLGEGS